MVCSIAKEHRPRACSWLLNVKCERTVPFFGHFESVQGSSITIGLEGGCDRSCQFKALVAKPALDASAIKEVCA